MSCLCPLQWENIQSNKNISHASAFDINSQILETNFAGLQLFPLIQLKKKISRSCSNVRAFCFIWALQSLATGDKGSHPFPMAAIKTIPKHVQVVSVGEAKLLSVRIIALSLLCVQKGVGDCELVSFGTSHRNVRVCSFSVHHYTVWGSVSRPHITFEDHIHLPVKLFSSQWENVLRSYGERVLSSRSHVEVINRLSTREKMCLPSSGGRGHVLLWPGRWPWVHHSLVKSLVLCREYQ